MSAGRDGGDAPKKSSMHTSSEKEFEDDFEEEEGGAQPASATPRVVTPAPNAVEQALASGIWKRQYDATSGKHYYYHVLTRKTTWDLYQELGVQPPPAMGFASLPPNSKSSENVDLAGQSTNSAQAPTLTLPSRALDSNSAGSGPLRSAEAVPSSEVVDSSPAVEEKEHRALPPSSARTHESDGHIRFQHCVDTEVQISDRR